MKEKIHIENPCLADWHKMTPAKSGRFCDSCRKVVIDFSDKTQEEVISYISKAADKNICGRYHERHTTVASGKWYDFLNKIELIFSGLKMQRLGVFLISTLLFFSACRRELLGKKQMLRKNELGKNHPTIMVKGKLTVVGSQNKVVRSQDKINEKDLLETSSSSFNKSMEFNVGQRFKLSHIYFDQGKYNLQDASKPELDDLIEFMTKFPHVRIRLEGHTTADGDPQKCIELSENRVKEVKKYLVEKGIAENRVEWVGYGGSKPLNSGDTPALKLLNRRVEMVIIEK
jgi:outer membrane protein OmpA-like peptidoglycan-associated protein